MGDNIYLFVPNIIGYARIVLAFVSFYYMPSNHVIAMWCYLLSGFLDAIDGHAARIFNQSSRFGAMLDMLTDRCATMCLLVVLASFYPAYMFLFQCAMVVDIASHWIHLQSSLMAGSSSHKIDLSGNPLLRHYYTDRRLLFVMCGGNELFFSMLYLLYFTSGPTIPVISTGLCTVIAVLCAPIAFLKFLISLVQLYAACQNITAIDVSERETMAKQH